MVPFLEVGATYHELRQEIDAATERVLASGWFLLGPELERFEHDWAQACGTAYCAGVGSGLDALVLALRALDIGPGDEVIVPAHTFIATWLAVTAVGAVIVPVDPDNRTFNITANAIDAAVTPRTAAIMPVHLYGLPVDVRAIDAIAARYGLPVVYDAAQAHGARVGGRPAGSFGTMSAWSFYPGKNLGAFGDAGAVTSNDPALIERIRTLRNYGSQVKYQHDELGMNSRLDEFQAAVLSVKLSRLDQWNARRTEIALQYQRDLEVSDLVLPHAPEELQHAWHLFVVRSQNRDALRSHLERRGVQVGVHYPIPPHRQKAYQSLSITGLPVAEMLADQVLSLPIGPHLTAEHAGLVTRTLLTAADGRTALSPLC